MKKQQKSDHQEAEAAKEQVQGPDYQALYQRALADQENMRKRFADERSLMSKIAIGDLVLELLPVLDNFTRATEHVPEAEKSSSWAQGILYIRKQLMDVLTERGVSEVSAKQGDVFDPNCHEAIGTVVSSEGDDDTIAEVKNVGYKLHDRVIRPVQVIVNTKETK